MDLDSLKKLREPFKESQISKLPKPTKRDNKKGNCNVCKGYHGLPAVHLDYVGHAALTDRLLDVDPEWNWSPVMTDIGGLPVLDASGGMWIKLTVCGVTRLGYGDAPNKTRGDAVKERIGDALRNAAMRFGAGLDLWHKGDLHPDEEAQKDEPSQNVTRDYKFLYQVGMVKAELFEAVGNEVGEKLYRAELKIRGCKKSNELLDRKDQVGFYQAIGILIEESKKAEATNGK